MFIYDVIVEEFLDYPANFRLFMKVLPKPSVQFYIGKIDYETYLVQNNKIEYHDLKNDQQVCKWNDMDLVHDVI